MVGYLMFLDSKDVEASGKLYGGLHQISASINPNPIFGNGPIEEEPKYCLLGGCDLCFGGADPRQIFTLPYVVLLDLAVGADIKTIYISLGCLHLEQYLIEAMNLTINLPVHWTSHQASKNRIHRTVSCRHHPQIYAFPHLQQCHKMSENAICSCRLKGRPKKNLNVGNIVEKMRTTLVAVSISDFRLH